MRLTPDADGPTPPESPDELTLEESRVLISGALAVLHPFHETWEQARSYYLADSETQLAGVRAEHEWLTTHRQSPPPDPLRVLGPALDRLHATLDEPGHVWCASGWHRLVAETDRRLAVLDPGYQLISAKEKFGTLSLWARPGARGSVSDQQLHLFESTVSAAEIASGFICEVCGRPDGRLRGTPPWRVRTLCETHGTWGVRP